MEVRHARRWRRLGGLPRPGLGVRGAATTAAAAAGAAAAASAQATVRHRGVRRAYAFPRGSARGKREGVVDGRRQRRRARERRRGGHRVLTLSLPISFTDRVPHPSHSAPCSADVTVVTPVATVHARIDTASGAGGTPPGGEEAVCREASGATHRRCHSGSRLFYPGVEAGPVLREPLYRRSLRVGGLRFSAQSGGGRGVCCGSSSGGGSGGSRRQLRGGRSPRFGAGHRTAPGVPQRWRRGRHSPDCDARLT